MSSLFPENIEEEFSVWLVRRPSKRRTLKEIENSSLHLYYSWRNGLLLWGSACLLYISYKSLSSKILQFLSLLDMLEHCNLRVWLYSSPRTPPVYLDLFYFNKKFRYLSFFFFNNFWTPLQNILVACNRFPDMSQVAKY